MKTKKMKILLSVIFVILLLALVVLLVHINSSTDWKRLYEITAYEDIVGSPISEIRLRRGITSAKWAVSSDEDTIEIWATVLNGMEVRRSTLSAKDSDTTLVVDIKTEISDFSLVIESISGEYKLEINGIIYDIREPEAIPFEETYNAVIERHGVKSPWD